MFGEVPVYYTSGDKLVIAQGGVDRRQNAQFRTVPVYNPYVYSTTSSIVGDEDSE